MTSHPEATRFFEPSGRRRLPTEQRDGGHRQPRERPGNKRVQTATPAGARSGIAQDFPGGLANSVPHAVCRLTVTSGWPRLVRNSQHLARGGSYRTAVRRGNGDCRLCGRGHDCGRASPCPHDGRTTNRNVINDHVLTSGCSAPRQDLPWFMTGLRPTFAPNSVNKGSATIGMRLTS